MAALSDYYNSQFPGAGNYQIPAPQYTAQPPRGADAGLFSSPIGSLLTGIPGNIINDIPIIGDIFGSKPKKPKAPATGAAEYWKGRALLNAYNWLLPQTAATVQRGATAFGDIYRNEATKSKAYELQQFQDYAPLFAKAVLNADPRQAAMLEAYNQALTGNTQQAQSYVDRLRGQLDRPMDNASARDIIQSSLGNSAMRGFGNGGRDAALAYIRTGLMGQQLQQQREGTYQSALGLLGGATGQMAGGIQANKSVLGDPFLAFAGRPSNPQGSNPQSPDYGGFNNDLFSYSVNRDIQSQNLAAAKSASNQAMLGSLLGSVLGVAGKAGPGVIGAFCWVAREVLGTEDNRWLQFRDWMLHKAPDWFRDWYVAHGEEYAIIIKDKPKRKAQWRAFMEARIAEGV